MNKKILILGASGMLGNSLFRYFFHKEDLEVYGTARSLQSIQGLPESMRCRILTGIDVENYDHVVELLRGLRPQIVINCIGIVKQLSNAKDVLSVLPINALVPHRLSRILSILGARMIHFSSDCVFSGDRGLYDENDTPDPTDLYGRSKLLGEVDYPNAICLRTSLIGHELHSNLSLIDWFLSQRETVKGFRRAVFSGLPTVEMARVIYKYILPNNDLRGLYHVSGEPINKYKLLKLVAKEYGLNIPIIPDDTFIIDRSLDSSRFRIMTGYSPKSWPELIKDMHNFH